MKTVFGYFPVLLLLCFCVFGPRARGQSASKDWNVAFLNQVLASAPPNQTTVQLGDMRVLVRNVKAWRDRLAGIPSPELAFDGAAPTWTSGNVYYTFDSSVSAFKQQVAVVCMGEWATFANIHFIARTTEPNYFTFRENPSLGGGQSAVGMIGGQQFLDIGPNAWNHATLCHELGHTLGLIHEHQRSDRDSYVIILTNNIDPGQLGNFVKLDDSNNRGAYDFLSVMHYNRGSFPVSPGLDTIQPLPAYMQFIDIMGAQFDPVLSTLDRSGMVSIYGAGPVPSPVVTNTQDSGPGSLRTALYYGFDHAGTTITFNLATSDPGFSNGVFNIKPTDNLPSLFNATTLNGTNGPTNTNPNGPSILISGTLASTPSTFASGIHFRGTNSSVRSLIVNGFSGYGVLLDGTNATGNAVRGCYIGIDATGSNAAANGFPTVEIQNGANNNVIGGTLPGDRNVVGGSPYQGIVIRDPGTKNNTITGNYIGLNATGTTAISNAWAGINIFNGAQSNTIGGAVSSMRNVISGNGNQGILLQDTNTSFNAIQGNYIGVNAAGTAAIPNGWAGVDLFNGPQGTLIGGRLPGAGNVISGNSLEGIVISQSNTLGTVIQGNLVGLNALGTSALSNGWAGIEMYGGTSANQIGGTTAGSSNIISGNGNQGILINGCAFNVIQGNYIGLDASGTAAVSNGWAGVNFFNQAQSNLVGGPLAAMRNVISGNGYQGILLQDTNTSFNTVQGNYIGVNAAGSAAISNGWAGVDIYGGASSNLIGGSFPGAGNVISGNGNQGVVITYPGTSGNLIQGNYIGVNAVGSAAIGNSYSGLELFNSSSANTIGGGPGERNIISGNGNSGILMADAGTDANLVQGNTIGLNAAGSAPIPNANAGISIFNGPCSNQIGGVSPGNANLIAGNHSDGIQFFDAITSNNTARANSIFSNGGQGLILYSSANASQAAPVLTNASVTTVTTIGGTLTSHPSTTFHLDFYSSPPPSFLAQAQYWLGSRDVTTGVGGTVNFNVALTPLLFAGAVVKATATDPTGNTSSLSSAVTVTALDSVGDGISDAWRAAHFGGAGNATNSQSCATCDPDRDGMNNLQEYQAGTGPTNSASILSLANPVRSGTNMLLSFQSVTGMVYRIESRNDLSTGTWSFLSDQLLSPGGTVQIIDPGVAALPIRFYRLSVLP